MKLVIVGAGGFGREVYHYAGNVAMVTGTHRVLGFADDNPRALDGFDLPVDVLGGAGSVGFDAETAFVIAVGDPVVRRRLATVVAKRGGRLATLVHPTAYVARDARLGAGCVVCPFAFVGTGAAVGANTVLNTYASIGHDAVVGDNCVFSPYAVVNGAVDLGSDVFLGTHSAVLPRVRVGCGSKISAGAVVHREVPVGALAAGNPARARVLFAPETEDV
ncbi:acetyltransferase [Actinoplanes sp. NPDC049548]|uniref:acetyltransferase n=1 Tax=Actinoplanes sp. NPDC049548 TaxID=3155152 RepID=UPI0034461338